MASRLNPYLTFAGDARQAMEFYQEVFGGKLLADKIMHGMLETPSGPWTVNISEPTG